jgi:light-regulated signal transduction histidine kinase (bacteriophytochrome)
MNRWLDDHAALQHDLRNSINIVLGFCSVLQQTEPLIRDQARYLDWIKRAAETMARRIEQVPASSSLPTPEHTTGRGA